MTEQLTLGERILLARRKVNASQTTIAEVCATNRQEVGKWENNRAVPSLIDTIRLAEFTGYPLRFFTDDLPLDLRDQGEGNCRCNSVEQLDLFSPTGQAADVRIGGVLWELSGRMSGSTSANVANETKSLDEQLVA